MPRSGPRKIQKYSAEFKVTAVRLSQQPGLQVQAVAHALEIHPFMLSKWRKDLRDGRLRGRSKAVVPPRLYRVTPRSPASPRRAAALCASRTRGARAQGIVLPLAQGGAPA